MFKLVIVSSVVVVFMVGLLLFKLGTSNNWACGAEDEVVVIDNTCKHVDELRSAK